MSNEELLQSFLSNLIQSSQSALHNRLLKLFMRKKFLSNDQLNGVFQLIISEINAAEEDARVEVINNNSSLLTLIIQSGLQGPLITTAYQGSFIQSISYRHCSVLAFCAHQTDRVLSRGFFSLSPERTHTSGRTLCTCPDFTDLISYSNLSSRGPKDK